MNPLLKRLSFVLAVLAAAVILAPAIFHADEFDLKTYISVNQPFQLPGATLQANTKYILKRLDHGMTDPHVLQVRTADGKVISTFYAISAERLEPTGKTLLTFYETAPGYARPAREWFYPGRTIGYHFLYRKEKMTEISAHLVGAESTVQTAQVQHESFQTEPGSEQVAPDQGTMAQNSQSEQSEIERQKPADTAVTEPEPAPAPMQSDNAAATQESDTGNSNMPAQLPKTAGELPMLILVGLGSLGLRKMF